MAAAEEVRMEVGFTGGGSLQLSTDKSQYEQFHAALTGDKERWVKIVDRDEAEYLVGVSEVIYVRVASMSRAVGFGG